MDATRFPLVDDVFVINTVREVLPLPNETVMFPVDNEGLLLLTPSVHVGLDVWGLPGDMDFVLARLSITGDVVIRTIRASARRLR